MGERNSNRQQKVKNRIDLDIVLLFMIITAFFLIISFCTALFKDIFLLLQVCCTIPFFLMSSMLYFKVSYKRNIQGRDNLG